MSMARDPEKSAVIYLTAYLLRIYMAGIDGRVFLDARCFEMMRLCRDRHFVYDSKMNEERLIRVIAWARR